MSSTTEAPTSDASYAKTLKALHKPGDPTIFASIYDLASFITILSLNKSASKPVNAIGKASCAIAETLGTRDEDRTYEQIMTVIESMLRVVRGARLPLSFDIQDGH